MNAALRVSVMSAGWTTVSSAAAVAVGVRSRAAVLIAFGAVGIVDAIGSVALACHFLHGRRHDELSDRLERVAHRLVLGGLLTVGSASVIGGVIRLAAAGSDRSSNGGIALAAISLVVLSVLSARKQVVSRRISSSALRSDAHLSAIGAVLAAVSLSGTAAARWFAWHWADGAATVLVGGVAAWLAISTWRGDDARRTARSRMPSWPVLALLWMVAAAALDAV